MSKVRALSDRATAVGGLVMVACAILASVAMMSSAYTTAETVEADWLLLIPICLSAGFMDRRSGRRIRENPTARERDDWLAAAVSFSLEGEEIKFENGIYRRILDFYEYEDMIEPEVHFETLIARCDLDFLTPVQTSAATPGSTARGTRDRALTVNEILNEPSSNRRGSLGLWQSDTGRPAVICTISSEDAHGWIAN